MKKIILAIVVVIIVFAFTFPLYATPATGDLGLNKADPTSRICYKCSCLYSSFYIHNGGDFGCGYPSHGQEVPKFKGC